MTSLPWGWKLKKIVIPAQARIHAEIESQFTTATSRQRSEEPPRYWKHAVARLRADWIPACTGMTDSRIALPILAEQLRFVANQESA